MRTLWTALLLTVVLSISACSVLPTAITATPVSKPETVETPSVEPAANSKPVLKTTLGDFVVDSARWVNEVNGVTAGEDEKILLVILTQPGLERLDPEEFSLEAFDQALRDPSKGEVHIAGSDGSYSICTMAGWVGEKYDEFAMGFRLPVTAKTGHLVWPDNPPVEIFPN